MNWTLGARARLGIRVILSASGDRFGLEARRRYRRLLTQAIEDVAADPQRVGVQSAGALGDMRLYHTRHARLRAGGRPINRPRHVIAFRIVSDQIVILRVLHDAMDLPEHLKDL